LSQGDVILEPEAHSRPLRVVVLYSSGHLGSAMILNRLLDMPEFEVVGVVRANPIPFSKKGIKKLRQHLKKVGWQFGWLLFWQQMIQVFSYLITSLCRKPSKGMRPTWQLAIQSNLPVFQTQNINARRTRAFIRSLKSDLLISAYFSQILKPEVIALPKLGILNVHPGWLPAYKGAMAYFWVLKNGSETAGVSLHWIDEGIDTGTLLRRQSFSIDAGMTQQNVLEQTADIGANLLQEAAQQLLQQGFISPTPVEQSESDEYYPMPGSKEFESYFKRRRFFRIRDVFKMIFSPSKK